MVWCATYQPKLNTVQKISEITKKHQKMSVFRRFFKVSEFWAQFYPTKLPNSNSVDNFASLDTPGGPGGVKVVEIFEFETFFNCFLDVGATWRKKIDFFQIEASGHLYYVSCLKSDIITLHSHNTIILKEIHSFKP